MGKGSARNFLAVSMSRPKSSMTMATLDRDGASGGPGGAGGAEGKAWNGGGDGDESASDSFSPVFDEGGSLPDEVLAAFVAVWDLPFADVVPAAEDEAPEEGATLEFAAFEGSTARPVACREVEETLLRALEPTDLPVSPQ